MNLLETAHQKIQRLLVFSADRHGVSADEILSRKQKRQIVGARHEVFYLASQEGVSTCKIASITGRDHNTVKHGIRRYAETLEAAQ